MNPEAIKTRKGNGATGYWRNRGAFDVYVNGHLIGREATPEQAQNRIDQIERLQREGGHR